MPRRSEPDPPPPETGGALARCEARLRAEPRTWLVTGAAGFIGSHLVERLLALGQRVRGLDDFSAGREENLASVARSVGPQRWGAFELVRGDVTELAVVRAACAGIGVVLHQAGRGSVPRSLSEPGRSLAVHARGTWNVLAAAHAAGAARVVLASSSSVYGDRPETPQSEERIGQPLSPYAASKRAAELAAEGFSRALGLSSVALRYFNVFGARQDPEGAYAAVIPRWCAALLAGRSPLLEGSGEQTRDFTPVRAVVGANLLAASAPLHEPYRVVNVGTGTETRLAALLERLGVLAAELGAVPLPPQRAPARAGDRGRSLADLARARRELGYEPPSDLAQDLRATLRELVDSHARAS